MRLAPFLLLPLFLLHAADSKEIVIYVTANLGGHFPLSSEWQDNTMLRVAAYLRATKTKNPTSFHVDMGNAFFPGRLSRFSFGAITADYFQMLQLDAGLVASGDLNIGAESLDYIRRARGVRLLSANIMRDKDPFFEPYAIVRRGGIRVAFIGITSHKGIVGFAEARHLQIHIDPPSQHLANLLPQIAIEKPELTIMLSGLSLREAIPLLAAQPQIDILLCGGDSDSRIAKTEIRQVELPDGRLVIAMPPNTPLTRLALRRFGKRWQLSGYEAIDLSAHELSATAFASFLRRLQLWQKWYAASEDRDELKFEPFQLTPQFAAGSLRALLGCDVAYLEKDEIALESGLSVKKTQDIRDAVQNDYDIFTFRMTGNRLQQFRQANRELIFSGMDRDTIIGHPIRNDVSYRICATQRGYE
ncbi:MAG: hypothetical protein N2Z22_07750, partial [Turneriella sp.]|nr:hypothetical protein [Turneriella sp.]